MGKKVNKENIAIQEFNSFLKASGANLFSERTVKYEQPISENLAAYMNDHRETISLPSGEYDIARITDKSVFLPDEEVAEGDLLRCLAPAPGKRFDSLVVVTTGSSEDEDEE